LRRRQTLYENLSTTGLFLIVIVVVFPGPSGARSSPPVVVVPRMIVGSPVSIMVGSPVSIMVGSPVSIVVSPVPIRVPVVWVGIHHLRSGNHHRCWRHVHGLRSDHDRNRQPKTKGHMDPSRVCGERQQDKAC